MTLRSDASASASAGAERFPLRRVDLLAIFAFWTFFALLSAGNGMLDPRGRALYGMYPAAPFALALSVAYAWAALTPLLFWIAARFSADRGSWARRVLALLLIALVIAMCMDFLLAFARMHLLPARPRGPPELNFFVRASRFWFMNQFIVVAAILCAGFARNFFLRYHARREEAIRLTAQLADARLAALRSQLDPHFLFNTLHAVSALVERDPRGVRRMIARLSELLRMTLEGRREQEIPLREELDFLDRYLEIMLIRFQGRLEIEKRIDPRLDDALVPNLVLQPLVENAIQHGVAKIEGVGRIEIVARLDGSTVVLSVLDNGPGRAESSTPAEGIGLGNTRERLVQLYGADQSLTLMPRESGGVHAQVRLPLHGRADLRVPGAEISA